MSKDALHVAALHNVGGINCSQAMLSVYGKYFGMPKELAIKVATAFGGGMGGMGKTCGAVTGAFLVFGLTYEIGNPNREAKYMVLSRSLPKDLSISMAQSPVLNC
ncbi:MAG: hypothetical protein K0R55_1968 [Sporomusa sp.]|jgi:C_GCAxxG_C_C family probable redox protein|nr:hypothetical protein [Sporomusa sp.]